MGSSPSSRSKTTDLGSLAESLVVQWLSGQGWQLVAQRWHCRWGELDVVALAPEGILAFVEVKARSRGSWDAGGLLAITAAKQEKLTLAAQSFLVAQPEWASYPCRFDVAIVQAQPKVKPRFQSSSLDSSLSSSLSSGQSSGQSLGQLHLESVVQLGQPQSMGNYWLTLQDYRMGAFEAG